MFIATIIIARARVPNVKVGSEISADIGGSRIVGEVREVEPVPLLALVRLVIAFSEVD